MISDDDLYRLAMFLGSCSVMMAILYHFLEVNAQNDETTGDVSLAGAGKSSVEAKSPSVAAGAGTNSAGSGSGKSR